jgi:hypothetical protein
VAKTQAQKLSKIRPLVTRQRGQSGQSLNNWDYEKTKIKNFRFCKVGTRDYASYALVLGSCVQSQCLFVSSPSRNTPSPRLPPNSDPNVQHRLMKITWCYKRYAKTFKKRCHYWKPTGKWFFFKFQFWKILFQVCPASPEDGSTLIIISAESSSSAHKPLLCRGERSSSSAHKSVHSRGRALTNLSTLSRESAQPLSTPAFKQLWLWVVLFLASLFETKMNALIVKDFRNWKKNSCASVITLPQTLLKY